MCQYPAVDYHSGEGSDGKRTAAESEQKYPVSLVVDAHECLVQLSNIARQAKSRCAGEYFERLEPLRADSVVLDSYLRGQSGVASMTVQIDRFKKLEDVGSPALDSGISGPVGTNDNVL